MDWVRMLVQVIGSYIPVLLRKESEKTKFLGSSKLIINSVESALKQSNLGGSNKGKKSFELKVIDFQSALYFIDHVLNDPARKKEHEINFLTNPLLKISPGKKAFSPGMYEIEDVDFDGEENDDDDEQEDADFEPSSARNEVNFLPSQISQSRSANHAAKLFLNINLLPNNKAQKKETPEPAQKPLLETFQLQNLTLSSTHNKLNKDATFEEQRSLKSQTAYDRVLSDQDINSYLTYLKKQLVDAFQEEKKKVVLIVRDVTELIEYTRNESGRKLFFGLMDLISQLRNEMIPSVLVASCTPSLMEKKNIRKDIDFYTQIIDGNLPNFSSKGGLTMAADGSLFQTCLDSFEDYFDKVELLPPAKTFHSLRSLKAKTDPLKAYKTSHNHQFLLFQYLSEQERDMKLRIAEINIKMILEACLSSCITLKFPIWDLVADQKLADVSDVYTHSIYNHGLKKDLQLPIESYALELLTREIWNYGIVDKLLKLALGSQLDSADLQDDTQIDYLELESFEMALKIMYETDITRCSSVLHHGEKDVSPAEGEGGIEKLTEEAQPNSSVQPNVLKPKTVFNNNDSTTNRSDDDNIASEMRRLGIKLSKHEKRILSTVVNPHKLKVEFKDLILPPPTKLILQTLVTLPLLRPEFFQTGILARSSINGVLLFGPPGTGKTMLAKAVAKSSGSWFMNVCLSDIFEKYVGEGEKNVRAIFSLARKLPGPCIIFLDEVDAVFGTRRSDTSGTSKREIMNEFMAEWDGLVSNNEGLVVLGATNRPFDLDDAILRRMPRRILVDLPTEQARLQILQAHLQGEELDESIDLADLAKRTNNYSGSDLKNVCISAALNRMKECILYDYMKEEKKEVNNDELLKKVEEIDDWGNYLSETPLKLEHLPKISKLAKRHIDIGLKECPPSLSEEMLTLVELRKWDSLYGNGASSHKKKGGLKGIGFATKNPSVSLS